MPDPLRLFFPGLVVTLPAMITALVLWILQRSRGITLTRSPSASAATEGLQFSIKHLMAATVIVAAIISIRQGLQSLGFEVRGWGDLAIVAAVVVPCVLLVELATFWAALGLSRPIPRLMIVVPSGFLVGIVPPFYFPNGEGWKAFAAWSGIVGLHALFTAATLLVFRASGWRLCRAVSENEAEMLEPAFETPAITGSGIATNAG